MDYTLEGIRNRVLIDKLDDDEFNTDIVDRFINDTQRDIFNQYELPFQEKIFEGTVPSGTTMFKFPDDVAQIQSQVITGPTGEQQDLHELFVNFRTFNSMHPLPANGEPSKVVRWTLYARNMLLSAPLDQDYKMTMFYVKRPTVLILPSQVPEIPEEFGELLVLGAFKRIQQRNEDFDLAAVTEQHYNNMLDMLVARYGFRHADGPIKMKNQQI